MELVAFGDINKFGISSGLRFSWEMTQVCNFRCWYCDYKPDNEKHIAKKPDHEIMMKIIDFFKEVSKTKKIYKIMLCAAEITTIPDVHYYVDELSKSVDTLIQVNSNMSAPLSTYIKICDNILNNGNSVLFFPSYHREFIDVYKFFNKIESLCKRYKDRNFSVMTPSFMVHSELCLNLAHKLHNTPGYEHIVFSLDCIREVNMKFDQIWDEDMFHSNRRTLIGIYKDGNEYKYKYKPIKRPFLPNFDRFICECPNHMAMIRYNGGIDFCSSQYGNVKLNVTDDNFIDVYDSKTAVICHMNHCSCDFDIPKYKMLEYPKLKEWTKEDILKLEKL